MRPDLVMREVALGTSFVCASCVHFWTAKDRKLEGCMAVHQGIKCAGPLKGMGFPNYKGVMEGFLNQACFVCGNSPDALVLTPDQRSVGVCSSHIELLSTYSEGSSRPPFITKHVASSIKR